MGLTGGGTTPDNPERDELYHIAYDSEESTNLIRKSEEGIQQMIEKLHSKIIVNMKAINDPLLDEIRIDKDYYRHK